MSTCDEYRKMVKEKEDEIQWIQTHPTVIIPQAARDREKIEKLERDVERLKGKLERSLRRGGC